MRVDLEIGLSQGSDPRGIATFALIIIIYYVRGTYNVRDVINYLLKRTWEYLADSIAATATKTPPDVYPQSATRRVVLA